MFCANVRVRVCVSVSPKSTEIVPGRVRSRAHELACVWWVYGGAVCVHVLERGPCWPKVEASDSAHVTTNSASEATQKLRDRHNMSALSAEPSITLEPATHDAAQQGASEENAMLLDHKVFEWLNWSPPASSKCGKTIARCFPGLFATVIPQRSFRSRLLRLTSHQLTTLLQAHSPAPQS